MPRQVSSSDRNARQNVDSKLPRAGSIDRSLKRTLATNFVRVTHAPLSFTGFLPYLVTKMPINYLLLSVKASILNKFLFLISHSFNHGPVIA